MENLDLTSLNNAINSLEEVIVLYNSDKSDKIIRDSLIQRFEYCYSLSLKMIKKYLKLTSYDINVEELTFNDLIRNANKMGLLNSNLEVWSDYRIKRNMTSHTYDEETAQKVVYVIASFFEDAKFLLNKLKEKTV